GHERQHGVVGVGLGRLGVGLGLRLALGGDRLGRLGVGLGLARKDRLIVGVALHADLLVADLAQRRADLAEHVLAARRQIGFAGREQDLIDQLELDRAVGGGDLAVLADGLGELG